MADLFHRRQLADQMAQQLLQPDELNVGLRSGLFLSGLRRTGKTTFLRQDFIPALEERGALVIYVDLWSDVQASPATLVHSAIAAALADMEKPASGILQRLKRVKSLDVGAAGFKFGFQLDALGQKNGPSIAQALTEVVDFAKTDVVMIIDEVQHALATEEGRNLLLALKAARDAINTRPGTPGHFLFVGTGSHRAQVSEMSTGRTQAFAGATSLPYPLLDKEYVQYLLQRLAAQRFKVPSLDVAYELFQKLGSRPEEMLRAIRQLQQPQPAGTSMDDAFRIIAATIRMSAADRELAKVEELGSLAEAIFGKIARAANGTKGLFSADALAEYTKVTGSDVKMDQVQRVTRDLADANVVMRTAHGLYCVTDAFVQEVWLENYGPAAQPAPALEAQGKAEPLTGTLRPKKGNPPADSGLQ